MANPFRLNNSIIIRIGLIGAFGPSVSFEFRVDLCPTLYLFGANLISSNWNIIKSKPVRYN